jgi:hypothetical protein
MRRPWAFDIATCAALLVLIVSNGFAQSISAPSYGFVPTHSTFAFVAKYAAVADFNGDSKPDIATVDGRAARDGSGSIRVVPGDGNGNFGAPIVSTVQPAADALLVADFNGDGKADLVTWGSLELPTKRFAILLGLGDGTFIQSADFPAFGMPGMNSFVYRLLTRVADFDLDGRPDLAIVNSQAGAIELRMGNGNGTFQEPVSYRASHPHLAHVAVADFTGDDRSDLVAVSAYPDAPGGGIMSLFRGNGDGSFASPEEIPPGLPSDSRDVGITAVVAADLDKNNRLDLVLLASTGPIVYLNRGDGTFAPPVSYQRPQSISSIRMAEPAVGDLTADGNLDLVVGYAGFDGSLLLFPGRGDGTLDTPAIYPVAFNPASFVLGDLNGDGRIDIPLVTESSSLIILNGAQAPFLRLTQTHNGDFLLDQDDAAFTIQVSNAGVAATSGVVTVKDIVGTYYELTSLSGMGWTCNVVPMSVLSGCTRSDPLEPGTSYPPITAQILMRLNSPSPATNQVLLSGGGSAGGEVTDAATVLPFGGSCVFFLNAPRVVSIGTGGGAFSYSSGGSFYCRYSVQSSEPWVNVYSSDGGAQVAANPTGAARSATLTFTSPSGWRDSIVIQQAGDAGCVFQLWPTSLTLGPTGARFQTTNVITAFDCPWTATVDVPWVTFGAGNARSGTGRYPTANFDVAPNLSGNNRSGKVTIAGQTFTVFQTATAMPSFLGSLAHIAAGGGWSSSIQLVNSGSTVAQASLSFTDDSGKPVSFPLAVVNGGLDTASPTLVRVMPSHSSVEIDSNGVGTVKAQTGAALLAGEDTVSGYIRFEYTATGQEAIVPLESRSASTYVLAFDNTGGDVTGVALANVQPQPTNISIVVRDESGAPLGNSTISLLARGRLSFLATDQFVGTRHKRGTIEFGTVPPGRIAVLGLRITASGAFNAIPVLAGTDAGGSLAQLASGGDWQTTITLVNTGAASAQAHLRFIDDNGSPLSLPLAFPQNSLGISTASSLDLTLAAHSMLLINSSAGGAGIRTGSAQLTTNGTISGFAVLRSIRNKQEAAVPLETRNAKTYILAFDNTDGLQTGVGMVNIEGQSTNVSVIIRDSGGSTIGMGSITLPGQGHLSFNLADRFPVTIGGLGTIEFSTDAFGRLAVLGLRFSRSNAFTTIPVIARQK